MISIACAGCLCAVVFKDGGYLLNSIYINQSAVFQALNLVSGYARGEEHKRSYLFCFISLINVKASKRCVCKALHTDASRGESAVLSENKMHICNLKMLANIIPVAVAMEAT